MSSTKNITPVPSRLRSRVRCTATSKRSGKPCRCWAVNGATVCSMHGAGAPQVAKVAAVRAELMAWGLADSTTGVDPGELLLRLVSQSAVRAQRYAVALEEAIAQHGLHDALVGDRLIQDPNTGKIQKVGEYVKGLAELEAQERDRLARFSAVALKAGVRERQVRLAERYGQQLELVLTAAFDAVGLSADQRRLAPDAIRKALTVVADPA